MLLCLLSLLGTWKDGENPVSSNGGVSNSQWAAFSPVESPAEVPTVNTWGNELDEEHSSSDEDADRSSSPELAGEEGEVLLRCVTCGRAIEIKRYSLGEEFDNVVKFQISS